jgi:hypothetical protein
MDNAQTKPAAPDPNATGDLPLPGILDRKEEGLEQRSQPDNRPAKLAQAAAEPAPTPPAHTAEALVARAQETERERVSTIYDLAARLGLERVFCDDLVKRNVGVDEARRVILDKVAETAERTRVFPHVSVPLGGRDERVTRRDAVANALLPKISSNVRSLRSAEGGLGGKEAD